MTVAFALHCIGDLDLMITGYYYFQSALSESLNMSEDLHKNPALMYNIKVLSVLFDRMLCL